MIDTWIANVFIVAGLWFIGEKKRWAWGFSIVGEGIWTVSAYNQQRYDLAFMCAVFFCLAIRSYYKWK